MNHYATYPSLKDKAVFITGGATGIGASLVSAFAAQGCRVAFVDIATREGESLAAHLQTHYAQPIYFQTCDVTQVAELRKAVRDAAKICGDFTVLINNVANDQRFDARTMSETEWHQSLAVNLDPAFLPLRQFTP